LITGAASGIGAAAVRALAAKGMTIVGTDIDHARGEALFAGLGAPNSYMPLDVRDAQSWHDTVAHVARKFGRLDFAYLNAGVMTRPGGAALMDDPLPWSTAEAYAKVMDINLGGVAHGIRAVLEAPGLSRILVTASGAGIRPLDRDPYYTASKFGVVGMVLAFAPVLANRGVRIDVICPGAIGTAITPADIRGLVPHGSPTFIGECVATLATTDEPGPVWLALTETEGLRRYDIPELQHPGSILNFKQDS
jgi:NAD(P)-dependent dehydrogenase (short-subunit alcohol dehydrogenase family)